MPLSNLFLTLPDQDAAKQILEFCGTDYISLYRVSKIFQKLIGKRNLDIAILLRLINQGLQIYPSPAYKFMPFNFREGVEKFKIAYGKENSNIPDLNAFAQSELIPREQTEAFKKYLHFIERDRLDPTYSRTRPTKVPELQPYQEILNLLPWDAERLSAHHDFDYFFSLLAANALQNLLVQGIRASKDKYPPQLQLVYLLFRSFTLGLTKTEFNSNLTPSLDKLQSMQFSHQANPWNKLFTVLEIFTMIMSLMLLLILLICCDDPGPWLIRFGFLVECVASHLVYQVMADLKFEHAGEFGEDPYFAGETLNAYIGDALINAHDTARTNLINFDPPVFEEAGGDLPTSLPILITIIKNKSFAAEQLMAATHAITCKVDQIEFKLNLKYAEHAYFFLQFLIVTMSADHSLHAGIAIGNLSFNMLCFLMPKSSVVTKFANTHTKIISESIQQNLLMFKAKATEAIACVSHRVHGLQF